MKRVMSQTIAVCYALLLTNQLNAQPGCFRAEVFSGPRVELRWCQESPSSTVYGSSLQRRNENDSLFGELPNSFCPGGQQWSDCLYTDGSVSPGVWIYRVQMLNLDGTITYPYGELGVPIAPTSVRESQRSNFSLEQNYPNPFNPTTTVRFRIPSDGLVSLKVYNMLSQEVATLVNEERAAGAHEVVFNASNLASGVYVCKLIAGSFNDTKKLVLVR